MTNVPKNPSRSERSGDEYEPAPRASSEASPGPRWRGRVGVWGLTLAWVVNAAILISLVAWTYFYGESLHALNTFQIGLGLPPQAVDSAHPTAQQSAAAVGPLKLAAILAAITLLAMLGGLFLGAPRFRAIRAWLAFTAIVGAWLGFCVAWPEIYWRGQQHRMKAVLAPVESLARMLEAEWPREDGDLPGIGPYLAYPKGHPTTVLPLSWVTFPDTALRISAFERTSDGAIRFALAGNEAGAWLEWRADDRPPAPFVSGLDTRYRIARQERLAPHWFLVRYRSGFLGSTMNAEQLP